MDNFFSLPPGAERRRQRRPEEPVFVSFDELRKDGPRQNMQVVPIEAVQPGDRQVLAAGDPRGECVEPTIALDPLIQFPEVCSVLASTTVTARLPLPHVRHLASFPSAPPPDAETLRNLPNLESLYIGGVNPFSRHFFNLERIPRLDLDALPSDSLARLWVVRDSIDRLESLSRLINLHDLSLIACERGDSLRHLSTLTKLRHLNITGAVGSGWRSGWKSLRACSALEEVSVDSLKLKDLSAFNTWTRLKSLSFRGKVLSLEGIQAFTELEQLRSRGGDTLVRDLSLLKTLRRLRVVEIATDTILDLSVLSETSTLERLELSGYAGKGESGVKSIRPLAGCNALREIELFRVVVKDRDLSVLEGLPNLQVLSIKEDDGSLAAAITALKRRRPTLRVKYERTVAEDEDPGIRIGKVTIHAPREGIDHWYIFEDLVDLVGGGGNGTVQDRVIRAVSKKNAKLLDRLDFDSEADNFGVYAESEEDIRAVAAIINELAAKRRQPKRGT